MPEWQRRSTSGGRVVRRKFGVPVLAVDDYLRGFAMDLLCFDELSPISHYEIFDDLFITQ